MKKICLFIASFAMLFTATAFGQTEKGNLLVGGIADFNIRLMRAGNLYSASLTPDAGLFVKDNFAIGGQLGIGYSKINNFTSTNFSIQPFSRYYFGPNKGYMFFAQARAGYSAGRSKGDTLDETFSGATFGLGPGIAFFLSDQIAIEGILEYTKSTGDFESSYLRLRFGVQAYLGGKDE